MPPAEDPLFSTTTAKVTISPASTPDMLLLMGVAVSPADVLGGVNRGHAALGRLTPVRPTLAGVYTSAGLSEPTTPFMIRNTGSKTWIWIIVSVSSSPPLVSPHAGGPDS
jgi:hypothetical protein